MEGQPTKLGKYQILGTLGRGAMGVVYKGFDPIIERPVAIKTMRRFHDPGDEVAREAEERFVREAKAAGRLAHPNIVAVYDFGEDGDIAFIVMELIEGRVLKELLEAKRIFGTNEIVDIMTKLLAALEYSHGMEVVHRDIKPGNIILTSSGEVKIMDFGIAKLESSTMTQVGAIMGTPSYMSPEQFLGEAIDRRSDIFSAGAVLYELLTGQKAFSGSLATVMHQVVDVDPPSPSTIRPNSAAAFDRVLQRALAKQADARYQTAAEFSRDIAAAAAETADGFPLGEEDDADGTVVLKPARRQTPPPSPSPSPSPSSQAVTSARKRWPIAVGGVVAALAVGGGLAWWLAPPRAQMAERAAPPPTIDPPPPPPLPAVEVVTERGAAPVYRVGENVQFTATVSADANVYCFYYQSSGEVFRVFPNGQSANSWQRAGEPLRIPGKARFKIRVDVPNSHEEVGCVAMTASLESYVPSLAAAPDLSPLPYPGLNALIEAIRSGSGGRAAVSVVDITVKD